MTVADCKLEHPVNAPTTTIYFAITSINFSIAKFGYNAVGGENDVLSGRFASSEQSLTNLKATFQLINDTDSGLKQARDFLKLIAENPYDENHMRLTMEWDSGEIWKLDGQIQPLNLLIRGGSPDLVDGSFTFDIMREESFS